MKSVLISASTYKALGLDEIKDHIHMIRGQTAEDDFLSGLRSAAEEFIENYTNRKVTRQTWKVYFDEFPGGDGIEIPYPPLVTIPSSGLVYTNSSGGNTKFSSTKWSADTVSEPGRLVLKYGESWPAPTLATNNPISIEFQCGYSATTIKQSIKNAMLLMIGQWYEGRENAVISGQSFQEMPIAAKALLAPYRIFRF